MDYKATIMSAVDVRDFSTIEKNAALCNLIMIRQLEENLLSSCFINNFYTELKNDLVDYSGVQVYAPSAVYQIGNTIKFDGVFYVAIAVTTSVTPPNLLNWTVGRKFKSDCFNDFFCSYLAYYLADNVLKNATALGVGKSERIQTKAEIDAYFRGINDSILVTYENMISYMRKTNCLSKYLPSQNCGCEGEEKEDCTIKKRRRTGQNWA